MPGVSLPPHRVAYLPAIDRPRVRWPDDARVAFWVAPNVEHYEYLPPRDPGRNPWVRSPHPDVQGYGYRDYGNRVGLWRMLEALDAHDITCTVSMNLAVFDHYPQVAAALVERGYEFMSHGIYNTRYLHALDEAEERDFFRRSVDLLRDHTGDALKGMLGPAVSNSPRTPDLMVEAGLIYHADWLHDDQPVPIAVANGRLVSVPYSLELNDVPVFAQHFEAEDFVAMAKAAFDTLYAEGESGGRVMCLALHPYLFGQPHRVAFLEEILDYVMSHDAVWQTTAAEIAEHFGTHHYDDFVSHAATLGGAR